MLSDEGEFKLPSERFQKSIEEQLASVIEGEGIVISGPISGGEGIVLAQEPNIIQLNRPRRKRRRMRLRGPVVMRVEEVSDVTDVTDVSSISVGLIEEPSGGFKVSTVKINYGEHVRSPFVVSLRGMSLTNDRVYDDERVLFSDVASFDVEPESVPSIAILGAMADDLYLRPRRISSSEQFTSDSIKRSWFGRIGSEVLFTWFKISRSIKSLFRGAQDRPSPVVFNAAQARRPSFDSLFKPKTSRSVYVLEIEDEQSIPPRKIALDLDIDPSSGNAVVVGAEQQTSSRRSRVLRSSGEGGSPVARPRIIRSLATISLLILIAMLPANIIRFVRDLRARQAAVAAASEGAIGALGGLGGADLQTSVEALRKASAEFEAADRILSETNALAVGISKLLPSTHASYSTAKALLEIGEKSSSAGQLLAKGLDKALTGGGTLLERIAAVRAYAQGALPLLEDSAKAFSSVDVSVVPEAQRDRVKQLGTFVEDGRTTLRDLIGMSDLMATMLGKEGKRRYLIIFQNPSELRATGGFMGSFAELDVDQGQIARLDVPGGGTYDLEGQLVAQVVPPKALQLVSSRWEFQDSNWSPDFPTAAKKIEWFWTKSGGYSLDGVIAVNATIVERLLDMTGPIEIPELGKTISSENFMVETQKAVELEYDREENKPKKIIGLLAPRLMERLKQLDAKGTLKLVGLISESMEQKDIQISLSDASEEKLAQSYGWSGRIKEVSGDSLAVIGSNIAGQKTDAVIKETVRQSVKISSDGRITDQVRLTRTHTGKKGDLFNGVRNVEYFRFYIPRGSTLVDASGFDVLPESLFDEPRKDAMIDPDLASGEFSAKETSFNVSVWDEGDRTVIGGWTTLDPGNTETLSVTYRLPFGAFDIRDRLSAHAANQEDGRAAYELLLTSQSGKIDRSVEVSVESDKDWNVHWVRSPEVVNGAWNRDRVISALYETDIK